MERLARAGLYKTLHVMDAAVNSVGYEVAELEEVGSGDEQGYASSANWSGRLN